MARIVSRPMNFRSESGKSHWPFECQHSMVVSDPHKRVVVCIACGKRGKTVEEVRGNERA